MARLLRVPNLPLSPTHLAGGLFAFAAVSCVVWMVSFMCASHGHHQPNKTTKSRRLIKVRSLLGAGEGRLREWGSDQSSKALLKMVSWMRLQEKYGGQEEDNSEGDGDDHHDEEAIWKKTIIMGQRCRPLEFSEKVVSDDSKSHLLPG